VGIPCGTRRVPHGDLRQLPFDAVVAVPFHTNGSVILAKVSVLKIAWEAW
jgi:hypothetical protein